jgi:hypothetical protein
MRFLLFVVLLAAVASPSILRTAYRTDRAATRQRSIAMLTEEMRKERLQGGVCQWSDPADHAQGYSCTFPRNTAAALTELMARNPYRR